MNLTKYTFYLNTFKQYVCKSSSASCDCSKLTFSFFFFFLNSVFRLVLKRAKKYKLSRLLYAKASQTCDNVLSITESDKEVLSNESDIDSLSYEME